LQPSTRIKTLIDKVFIGSATPAEYDELIAALKGTDYGPVLQEIEARLGNAGSGITDLSPDRWNALVDNILQIDAGTTPTSIKPLPGDQTLRKPVRRMRFLKYAAAACIIAALIPTVFLVRKNTGNNSLAVTTKEKEQPPPSADIRPGANRAVLQLADGTQISLDSTTTGTIARQGQANVLKQGDGRILYRPANGSNNTNSEPLFNILSTPRGGQFQLTLPDGTKVWLNAASYIKYPVCFDKKTRKVEIQGEAYLEVANNASKPFIVDAGDGMEIKVLGTHFNVNNYKEERYTRMTLLEGAIEVVSGKARRLLKPGDQALSGKDGGIRVEQVNTAAVVAWKNGLFDFNRSDIPSMMNQLARWYDVDVQYEGPLPPLLYGGEMERDLDLAQVVKLLATAGIHIKIKNKTLVLMP
jgi:transmembrane sensor